MRGPGGAACARTGALTRTCTRGIEAGESQPSCWSRARFVHVEHDGEALSCPQCGQPARRYDSDGAGVIWIRASTARFLMPRVHCPRCRWPHRGAKAARGSPPFEAIDLREAATSAVDSTASCSAPCPGSRVSAWMRRRSRNMSVTVVNDLDGHVLHVADGRGKESYKQFTVSARIQTVAMDMWEPYIRVSTQCGGRRSRSTSTLPDTLGTPLTGCGALSTAGWRCRRSAAER